MERQREGTVDRKVMKVRVEEFPLRSASIPPCSISSLAVSNGIEDSSVSIYLGTDTGYVLLFVWKRAPSSSVAAAPTFSRIRPLRSSPSRNSQPSTPSRQSVSPSREEILLSPGPASAAESDLEYQNGIDVADLKRNAAAASPERQNTDLKLSSHRCLGKSSVESLCILGNVGQLAVLLDGQVLLVDLQSLGLLSRISSCKGVSVIARSTGFEEKLPPSSAGRGSQKPDERSQLAVGMRNKILLLEVLSWQQEKENRTSAFSGTNPSVFKEINGIEGALTIAWIKNSVFIGTQREYLLYSLLSGRATLLFSFPIDSPWKPMLKVFPKEAEVLLVIDIAGIIVDTEGHPVAGSLVFSGVPDAIGQSSPYSVVANKGVVELFHSKTGSKVQSLAYGVGPCLVEDDNDSTVVIAKGDKVSCLVQVSIDDQLKELLKQKEYSEAIKLANECFVTGSEAEAKTRLAMVYAEAGFLLLSDLRFEEAIDHLLQSELVEPTEFFPFFPSLSSRWRSVIPRKRYWGLHPPPQPLRTVIENGLFSLQNGFLVSGLKEHQVPVLADAPSRSVLFNQYLLKAIKNFVRYWEVMRRRELSSSVREAIDTVLLKLYVELGASEELEVLVSSNNFCLLEEVESLLRTSGQLRALALLYESKNMLETSLQIWQYFARSASSTEATLDATNEAARLLETCSDISIVLQHITWIIDLDDQVALCILTSGKRENSLPADDVLAVLRVDSVIRQRYLQWLIEEKGVEDARIHTGLALSLADSALKSDREHDRLQNFLQSSDKYDVDEVLNLIGGTNLWKEQAILHMKLGNEVVALEILALKLEDRDAAERYCADLGRPDAYMQLLHTYLGNEGNAKHAVRLLHRHGGELDPVEVLEALPLDMPLHQACQALMRMLRARIHLHRHGQIGKNLTKGVNFQTRISALIERSREIQITSDTVCSSCNARIGTKLFAAYPNDLIVCYKCLRQMEKSKNVNVQTI